ncbi:Hypothetical predicted protein [Podarcis lilfordi]|uniref:Uncharacterized protein n=1 Tax=Podarcis lilfordi TaxID=74358 RepID=A0AA35KWC5_9SAUR|nr:Hypothetical predicted protein [Podarcis lilfordi]
MFPRRPRCARRRRVSSSSSSAAASSSPPRRPRSPGTSSRKATLPVRRALLLLLLPLPPAAAAAAASPPRSLPPELLLPPPPPPRSFLPRKEGRVPASRTLRPPRDPRHQRLCPPPWGRDLTSDWRSRGGGGATDSLALGSLSRTEQARGCAAGLPEAGRGKQPALEARRAVLYSCL